MENSKLLVEYISQTKAQSLDAWCQAIQTVCHNKMCAGNFSSIEGLQQYLRSSFLIDSDLNPEYKRGYTRGYDDGVNDGISIGRERGYEERNDQDYEY